MTELELAALGWRHSLVVHGASAQQLELLRYKRTGL